MTVKTQQIYYILLFQGYMFRLLRVIISPFNDMYSQYYYNAYCKRYGIPECTRN